MEQKGYYLGLDMGTSSVGWAVTDNEYHLLRKKGKDMWGIREFEPAETAAKRRSHRIDRRRRQREKARIGLLREYFADAIMQVDKDFFIRLDNSKYFMEDKDPKLHSVNGIFDDSNYKDEDYYRDYPTIFHLRKALLDIDNSKKVFDVRLVYLAVLNMFKHRGHFLLSTTDGGMSAVQIEEMYQSVIEGFNRDYGYALECQPFEHVLSIISDREIGRKRKYEKMAELFDVAKSNKKAHEFLKCMCGLKVNANIIFGVDAEGKIDVCFHDFSYADEISNLMEQLGDEKYVVIEQMKNIYDYAILAGIIKKGQEYLSPVRVDIYNKHHEDLKLLKELYRKYKTQKEYDEMFRSNGDGSYSAYVNSTNSSVESKKYRRNMKGRKSEDLYTAIKKAFKDYAEDEKVQYIFTQMENEQFLPKQLTGANGVIPNQVHHKELSRILQNAQQYLPFLQEIDESGLTVTERILQLFSFQIPYYVGPLGKQSKTGWVKRKEEGTILPWNINEKIDMKATSEEFISRLIRSCTYLTDEKVMPKASLTYERYCVLNEINNIRIDGERIDTQLKQSIYIVCFCEGKKVTKKKLCNHLIAQGVITSEEQVTGIDSTINSSLSSYGKMYKIFGDKLKEDQYWNIAEDIIYWGTVFADSREMFKEHLQQYIEQGVLESEEVKRILGYKFKDWGRYSKALLELQGCDKTTGEMISINRAMWDYSMNFMELINSDEFTFKDELVQKKTKAVKLLADFEYEDLQEYYFSAPVKRMIWQTILVVREIEHVMGCAPTKIFVEMTRNDEEKGDKGRKVSRGNQLLEAYKTIENTEIHNWKKEIMEAEGNGKLRSKKLYLYYMQMGRDMYTGEEIDLARLFDDNIYDIDHIYPRHYVKDDSILNNLVLVNKAANEHLKKDLYPVPDEITSNPKVRELWNTLHRNTRLQHCKLMNDEKYNRLISKTPFTEKQLGDFIARQLVQTSQGTKGIAELLQQLMPESRMVYAKASNVSEFRNRNGFVKSRLVNDFHHAQDAYLNIVVGNVYDTKFTQNPWNFIEKEYAKDKEANHYNLDKMFAWDVVRGDETAWIAEKKDCKGTIDTVRRMMKKNTPLMTRMSFEQHGEIANATLYSAKKAKPDNYFPLKTSDERMKDVTKYGGYTSATIAYYFIVKHKEGKKQSISIEGMPLYCKERVENSINGLENYCIEQLQYGDVQILYRKLKIQSLIEVNGYRMHLSGKTGNQLIMRNATNLCLEDKWIQYIKKIEKYIETAVLNEIINTQENELLYDKLVAKHVNTVFSKRPNACGDKLKKKREEFCSLEIKKQCKVLYEILKLTQIGTVVADLTLIGGSARTGIMQINKNIKEIDKVFLVEQSITGLYEKKESILSL